MGNSLPQIPVGVHPWISGSDKEEIDGKVWKILISTDQAFSIWSNLENFKVGKSGQRFFDQRNHRGNLGKQEGHASLTRLPVIKRRLDNLWMLVIKTVVILKISKIQQTLPGLEKKLLNRLTFFLFSLVDKLDHCVLSVILILTLGVPFNLNLLISLICGKHIVSS